MPNSNPAFVLLHFLFCAS